MPISRLQIVGRSTIGRRYESEQAVGTYSDRVAVDDSCAGARECAVFARFDIAAAKLVVDGIPASRLKRSGMRRSDNGIIIRK